MHTCYSFGVSLDRGHNIYCSRFLKRPGYNLLSDADDTASRSRTSVAGGLALLVTSLAQVIGTGMDNKRSLLADDQLRLQIRRIGWHILLRRSPARLA